MYAFLFLAIPAVILWYCFTDSKFSPKAFIPAILTGIFAGAIYTILLKFIFTIEETFTVSAGNYIRIMFTRNALIPVILLCGFFCLLSKDSWKFKAHNFLPLFLSFEEINTVYFAIGNQEKNSFFLLICLPAVTAAMVQIAAILLIKAEEIFKKETKNIIFTSLFAIGALLCIIMIFIIQACWYYNINKAVYIILTLLSIAASIILTRFFLYSGHSKDIALDK